MRKSVLILSLIFLILIGTITYFNFSPKPAVNVQLTVPENKTEQAVIIPYKEFKHDIAYISDEGVLIDSKLADLIYVEQRESVTVGIKLAEPEGFNSSELKNHPKDYVLEILSIRDRYYTKTAKDIILNLSSDELANIRDEGGLISGSTTKKGLEKLSHDERIEFIAIPFSGGGVADSDISVLNNQSSLPFVDPLTIASLSNASKVMVHIDLKKIFPIINPEQNTRDENTRLWREANKYYVNISLGIISNLSEDEFQLTDEVVNYDSFSGSLTWKGLEKLRVNPLIDSIRTSSITGHSNSVGTSPFISNTVYQQLNDSTLEWISVGVWVKATESVESVLSELNERDYQLKTVKNDYQTIFIGNISRSGFEKLKYSSRIDRILGNIFVGHVAGQSNYSASVDPEILKAFENNTYVEIFVNYISDNNITVENEEEMFGYYIENISIPKTFFDYIPESEVKIVGAMLSARKPSFIAKATKSGVEKLAQDPQVIRIGITREVHELENQTY